MSNVMKSINFKQLVEILNKHKLWLAGAKGGAKADLSYYDLSSTGVKFSMRDLNQANFTGADLKSAIFHFTTLDEADFSGANLEDADFRGAFLENAIFEGANLKNAVFKNEEVKGSLDAKKITDHSRGIQLKTNKEDSNDD